MNNNGKKYVEKIEMPRENQVFERVYERIMSHLMRSQYDDTSWYLDPDGNGNNRLCFVLDASGEQVVRVDRKNRIIELTGDVPIKEKKILLGFIKRKTLFRIEDF